MRLICMEFVSFALFTSFPKFIVVKLCTKIWQKIEVIYMNIIRSLILSFMSLSPFNLRYCNLLPAAKNI